MAGKTRSSVLVLAYHRVREAEGLVGSPTLLSATPEAFEAQMRWVASKYNVVSSWDVAKALRGEKRLPRRALVITFDDGYIDNYEVALPVLRELNLPATLFVPTSFPGDPRRNFWWDAIYRALTLTGKARIELPETGELPLRTRDERRAAFDKLVPLVEARGEKEGEELVRAVVEKCESDPPRRRELMDWEQLREMSEQGVELGPHTRNHIVLSKASPERARAEIEGSWEELRARIPGAVPIFCYPTGKPHAVNKAAAAIVRETGLVGAYTMVAGLNVLGRTNPYLMWRIGIEASDSLQRFKFKLSGAARVYRRVKGLVSPQARAQFNF